METNLTSQRFGMVSFICGILACSLNLLVITAVFGLLLGIVASVFGFMACKETKYGKAGLVLGFLSFFILIVYLFSFITVKVVDPFF